MLEASIRSGGGGDGDGGAVDVPREVERVLAEALARQASDVHVEPTSSGYEIRLRIDGLLHTVRTLPPEAGRGVVTRLMVMAQLLTYRVDVPQEGRLAFAQGLSGGRDAGSIITMRLSVMPTTHGLRAVVRLPAELTEARTLETLGLPAAALAGIRRFAHGDGGMLLVTGPAGAGKTTTIYAMLQYIAAQSPGISIVTLEDPVERDLSGVTQIEVQPFGGLTYAKALRSIVRQDPQVLMLGEVRDAETASIAVQAALSGHRLIATLHAGTPAGAVARLLEMGIEPYQLTSALFGVLSQRLLRRSVPGGGYKGRFPVAEFAIIDDAARRAILQRSDAQSLQRVLRQQPGYTGLREVAQEAIESGLTDEVEAKRVLGTDWSGHEPNA